MNSVSTSRIGPNESISLDLIRALSAQLVLFGHCLSFLSPHSLIGTKIPVQSLGVVIFFILSGYLIFTVSRKYSDFKSFFIDRFSRIYVTFIPCLMIIAGLDFLTSKLPGYQYADTYDVVTFVGNVVMLQDYPIGSVLERVGLHWGVTSFASGRPLWTLAVEWWLYMFFGWLSFRVVMRSDFSFRSIFVLMLLSIVPVAHATFARGEGLTLFWLLGAGIAAFCLHLPRMTAHLWAALCAFFILLATVRYGHVHFNFYDMQGAIFVASALAAMIGLARSNCFCLTYPRQS